VPASLRAGRPYNNDATALPTGDIQIPIVVADDAMFVERLGNAERPHAAVNRPIASLHRPSGWSRSFVLASLRALHLDQHLRPGALRAKRALTARPHTGNAERIRSEAAFAHLCGVAPIHASSGKTVRHRLNRGGNRQANHALWRIVFTRMSSDPRTRAYVERRTFEGRSKPEIMRVLKRYVAREVYRHLPRG
jgi:Transposase IS116/IS110/IS902 family